METKKFVGYTARAYCKINKTKSINPLAKLTYQNLQKVAKSLGLPAKLKVQFLCFLFSQALQTFSCWKRINFPQRDFFRPKKDKSQYRLCAILPHDKTALTFS